MNKTRPAAVKRVRGGAEGRFGGPLVGMRGACEEGEGALGRRGVPTSAGGFGEESMDRLRDGMALLGCGCLVFLGMGGAAALASEAPRVAALVGVLVVGAVGLVIGWRQLRGPGAADRAEAILAAHPGAGWERVMDAAGLGEAVARARPLARRAWRLAAHRTRTSRLGGIPDLPPDREWPTGTTFVARVDLAGVDDPLLPSTGALLFFHGEGEEGAVVHVEGEFPPRPAPEGVRVLPVRTVRLVPGVDPPPADRLGLDGEAALLWDRLRDGLNAPGEAPAHRLLGHADPVQEAMEVECELRSRGLAWDDWRRLDPPARDALERCADRWRLLLQLDSDDAAGLTWGDAGMLYWWMTEEDLRARRFDRALLIHQFG